MDGLTAESPDLARLRVPPRLVAWLLLARTAYRLASMVSVAALLPIWGADQYARYAAPLAALAWLVPVAFTGPEKAALKLLPRAGSDDGLTHLLVGLSWTLGMLAALPLALVAVVPSTAGTWCAAGAYLLSTGVVLLLVGVHRARGAARVDAVAFASLTTIQVAALVLAHLGVLGPLGYLVGCSSAGLGVALALAVPLGRPSMTMVRDHRRRRTLAVESILLGGPDLGWYLSTSALFALLAASGRSAHVATLFVAETVWSAGVNLVVYVLRVRAPETSLRLHGAAGRDSQLRALALARRLVAYGLVWTTVVLCTGLRADPVPSDPPGLLLAWSLYLLGLTPLIVGALLVSYWFEFTDESAARVTGAAAGASLVAACVVGAAVTPALGGLGLVTGLSVATLVQLIVFLRKGTRHVRS